jgi:hypothetical protein
MATYSRIERCNGCGKTGECTHSRAFMAPPLGWYVCKLVHADVALLVCSAECAEKAERRLREPDG